MDARRIFEDEFRYERVIAYLSIEGGLALGFIIPLVKSINWGDVVGVSFFPMTMLWAWVLHAGMALLAIALVFAAVSSFLCVLIGSPFGAILSWVPIVLMLLLRLVYRLLGNRLGRRARALIARIEMGGIIVLISMLFIGVGMMCGIEEEYVIIGKYTIFHPYSLSLTGTQLFLLIMIVSSSSFILLEIILKIADRLPA